VPAGKKYFNRAYVAHAKKPAELPASLDSPRPHLRSFLCVVVLCATMWLTACGGNAENQTVVRVGQHGITKGDVDHWISVLKGRGGNGREPGPPAPVPPAYTACIAYARTNQPPRKPTEPPPTPKALKAECEFEHRRYKLKALYLLISYQWVTGEAAELGLKLNRAELAQQLTGFKRVLNLNNSSFRRYLKFMRADTADLLLSFELEQLTRKVESKVASGGGTAQNHEQGLVRFGKAFERKWLSRTDCRPGYIVPICRQYKPPASPPDLTPPSVPLTAIPSGS
jgi:hypothetical protein